MSLDAESFTGHNLTTTWPFPVPLEYRGYDWGTKYPWRPRHTSLTTNMAAPPKQRTKWEAAVKRRDIVFQVVDRDHILSELKRLSRLAVVVDDISLVGYPTKGTNWMGVWNHMLRFAPGRDPLEALPAAQSGELLANLISIDIPENIEYSIDAVFSVLGEYQIAVDEVGNFEFLLDETPIKPLPKTVEFSYDIHYEPGETQAIGCKYFIPGQPEGTVVVGTTGDYPRYVKAPANSKAEATLEISLQRMRILKSESKGNAQIPLDLSWRPGDTTEREGRIWKVVRVDHSSSGGANPNLTTLALRGIPPVVFS